MALCFNNATAQNFEYICEFDIKCYGKFVDMQIFNHSVSVLITGLAEIPRKVVDSSKKDQVYLVCCLPVKELFDITFIGAFIQTGSFYMTSMRTNAEYHDSVALLPSGILVLNFTEETYQKFGLECTRRVGSKDHRRYVVELDLVETAKNAKKYSRLMQCFANHWNETMNFLFSWIPRDDMICSISVMRYFETKGFKCQIISPEVHHRCFPSVSCPVIDPRSYASESCEDTSCDHSEVFDWLGLLACEANVASTENGYLSTYCGPSLTYRDSVAVYTTSGLLTPRAIREILQELRNVCTREDKVAYLTVHAYSMSAIKDIPHSGSSGRQTSLYCFVLFPQGPAWLYKVYGS